MLGITIREFARRDGCNDKLVRRGIEKQRLKTLSDGSLDPKDVGGPWRKSNRNLEAADTADKGRGHPPKTVRTVNKVLTKDGRQRVEREAGNGGEQPDFEALKDFIQQILDGKFASQADAERVKENGLALKHLLEGRQKAGELVDLESAQSVLFETFRAARDAWLNFPTKVGPLIAAELGVDAERVVEALSPHVHQQLADLGEPEVDFAGTG